jgi:tetratricopeptide (TPR) repeat protein
MNRFMDVSPFGVCRCKISYIKYIEQHPESSCKGWREATNIRVAVASFVTVALKDLFLMKITSPKLDTSHLTANDAALRRCHTALKLKDKGDYDGAREVMNPLWKRVGERPEIKGLHPSVRAEVLLCVGILTRWIGSRNQIKESQNIARELISESITFYESAGDVKKVAAARAELAYCYWREGALDEARIMFTEALEKLTTEGNTRANAILGWAVVEWSASRYWMGLKILEDNAELFKKITNQTIKGTYHNQLAMVHQELAMSEKREDYFKRAIDEYENADYYFKLAHNKLFRADVKNNEGMLFYELSRFKEAHEHLDQARRLTLSLKDKIGVAQIDDTRAQVLIAEKKFKEAENVARHSVKVLDQSGHQCLLADSLITQGIALARLGKPEQAQFTFQRAMEVAHQVGALNKAGLAALTLLEEIDELDPDFADQLYDRATEWLAKSQSQEVFLRVIAASKKIRVKVRGELNAEDATEAIINTTRDLQQEMLKHEGILIKEALTKADGSLTRAASLLTLSYQALAYILEGRQKDLLKERSPIRRRSGKKQAPPRDAS